MLKLIKTILLILVIAGIIGGAIQIKFHPEKVSQIPGSVVGLVTSPDFLQQVSLVTQKSFRRAEMLLVGNSEENRDHRVEVLVGYIEKNANAVQAGDNSENNLELMAISLEHFQDTFTGLEEAQVSKYRADIEKVTQYVRSASETIQKNQENFQNRLTEINNIVSAFPAKEQPQKEAGEVAAAQDETPEPSPESDENPTQSSIPLDF